MILSKNYWPKTTNSLRYYLFAERCLELVNPHSWDSCRVHNLSTPSKINELLIVAHKVLSKKIPKPTIEPVVQELNEALKNDPIVIKIIKFKNIDLEIIKIDLKETIEEIISRTELLKSLINKSYREECKNEIIELCKSAGEKSKILLLAKLYIADLVGSGFHKEYIYKITKEHFFTNNIKRTHPGLLKKFFNHFKIDESKNSFTIYMCGTSKYINFLSGIFELKNYDNSNDLPNAPIKGIVSNFGEGLAKKIAVKENLFAYDHFSAVENLEKFLVLPRSFLFIYPSSHLSEGIDDEVYVRNNATKELRRVSRSSVISAIESKSSKTKKASKSVKTFSRYILSSETANDDKTRSMLMRSLNSASLASKANDAETQLITLWSAFEALLPEPSKEEGSGNRITHFAKLITPCVSFNYIENKYFECYENCKSEFGKPFWQFIQDHGTGISNEEKLAKLLLGDTKLQKQLCNIVSESPTMLHRLWKLQKLISDPKHMHKKILAHEERIRWQIHRIYRERNDIVHSGSSSKFTSGLVENAFVYYRIVIRSLEKTNNQFGIYKPHSAFQLISGKHTQRLELLNKLTKSKDSDIEIKKDLFKLIFEDTTINNS